MICFDWHLGQFIEPPGLIEDSGLPAYHYYALLPKNPHKIDAEHGDLDEMLADYQQLIADLSQTRNTLKQELMAALGGE
jgi:cbb3-type cytochrome oxidase cytochrome c subunit